MCSMWIACGCVPEYSQDRLSLCDYSKTGLDQGEPRQALVFVTFARQDSVQVCVCCLGCMLDDYVLCDCVLGVRLYACYCLWLEFTKLRAYPPFPLLVAGTSGNKKGKEPA